MTQIHVDSPENIMADILRRLTEPKEPERILSQEGLEYGKQRADGKTLVIFAPRAADADSYGLIYEPVCLATRRNKDMRIVTKLDTGWAYRIEGDTAFVIGGLDKIERALAVSEGTEFRGWNNTRQYRYTSDEIANAIKDKVFKYALDF